MLPVPPISWSDLAEWPIRDAGLPHRATRVLLEQGLQTLGHLHQAQRITPRRAIAGCGAATWRAIQHYLDLCERAAAGTLAFTSVRQLLDEFLLPQQHDILLRRYGLLRPDTAASRTFMTLQEIGNEFDITRERVRQSERDAIQRLQGRFQQHCLTYAFNEIRCHLTAHDHVLRCDHTNSLDTAPWLGGYKASSVILLLHDINPAHHTHYHDLFSLYSKAELVRTEDWIRSLLAQQDAPLPVAELLRHCPSHFPAWTEKALATFASSLPQVLATRDHRVMLTDNALKSWLAELLQPADGPMHYRDITHIANQHLQPQCPVGPRRILLLLHSDPLFHQPHSAHYELRTR